MADRSATILVVDDNPATRYSTSRVLRSEGFKVFEAASGCEALTLALDLPDLIVLDVNLPDMDGFEVCRLLRAMPAMVRTPVIHLSATFVKVSDQVQGLESGADGYLTHPIEPPVLVATVNAFLRARRAEDAMRASEVKFREVFTQAPSGIALLDEHLVYLDVNPAVCRTLGRERHDIVGQPVAAFIDASSASVLATIDASLNASGVWRGAFPVLHAHGHPVHLEWSVSLHSGRGTRLAITTDITERKSIEADRERLLVSERAARAEAERANVMKDEFLAALSHELRTPLNAIVGWADVLKRRIGDAEPELLRGLQAISRNARVQTQLIADLLDVSRITAGKLTLDLSWFDPKETLQVSAAALLPIAQSRNVTIETDLKATHQILWDQARFQQVIWNLLDNAIKFSPKDGTVVVRLTESPAGIDMSFEDHGRGISEEFLPHIFERFRQEDSTTKRWHGGLGLGLAIVQHLVDAHGGAVTASSNGPDKGSTFTVHIPLSHEQHEPAIASAEPPSPLLIGFRVLVVEDDDDARGLIGDMFTRVQAEVYLAADVYAAVAALETFRPTVVVSDIGMPGQDGYDLIRQIRASGYDADALPAVALTAFAREEDRRRVLQAGYQAHVSKPVDIQQLLRTVVELTSAAAKKSRSV
jgi:PAS domain S-box-containing protein